MLARSVGPSFNRETIHPCPGDIKATHVDVRERVGGGRGDSLVVVPEVGPIQVVGNVPFFLFSQFILV